MNRKQGFKIVQALASCVNPALVAGAGAICYLSENVELPPSPYELDFSRHFNQVSAPIEILEKIKNPLGFQIDKNASYANSVSYTDRRHPVPLSNAYYNMTGRITGQNTGTGSGSIIHNPYDTDHIYLLTAGHAVVDYTGAINPPHTINFTTTYIDEGRLKTFKSAGSSVMVNYVGNSQGPDSAIVRLDQTELPEAIIPGLVFPDYRGRPVRPLSTAGYSADRVGLTEDSYCSLFSMREGIFTSNCNLAQGASGGPVTIRVRNTPYIIATNSSIYLSSKVVKHHTISDMILQKSAEMPFGTTENLSEFLGCRTVEADILNFRDKPSMDGNVISQISRGFNTQVLSDEGEWIKIKDPEYHEGYVFKNYTRLAKCSNN